ncbi:MAG: hydantoinase/oxoprolinase family protein, partial [Butyricicoccus sp.]|nr:hydantoinase/oxoprolinase family protein [Butyricicoccus sp.]
MPVILGIDTGGTYTDSVLVDAGSRQVLHKAKAFTTRHNLLCGIAESLDNLQFDHPTDISMVCLSTTLATNAVVEHQGGRVGAFLLGRDAEGALPASCLHRLRGTMNIKGRILEDIIPDEAAKIARSWAGQIDAIAISGFASVRNPAHEQRIREIIQHELDVPVVCAHELSSSLGFHERTVTAILNAALIPNIRELIDATDRALLQRGIHAPIMIVKGDGNLMRADYARNRPIETVLSGPAASIVGGLFLSGIKDALLLDMGGTTSDLALVQDGQVAICTSGASVGGWRTQLRAAEISTFGIGGDSRLHWSMEGRLYVGPQRVLPLCVAGQRNPKLASELVFYSIPPEYELFEEQACECYAFLRPPRYREATIPEQQLFELLSDGPHPLFYLVQHLETDPKALDLTALVREGVLQRCGLTPTDLLHIRSRMTRWDAEASLAGAQALAARRGLPLEDFLQMAFAAVEDRLRESCLQATADFTHCTFSPHDPT